MKSAEKSPPVPKVAPSGRLGAVGEGTPASLGDADLSNVIVLSQRRKADAEAPEVVLSDDARPAPPLAVASRRTLWTAWLAAALLLHVGVVALFMREPTPLASVGLESISVELVLGGNEPAGVAETPSQSETPPSVASPASEPEPAQSEPEAKTADAEPEQTEEPEPQQTAEPSEPELKPSIVEQQQAAAAPAETADVREPEPQSEPKPEPPAAAPKQKASAKPREQKKAAAPKQAASVAAAPSSGIGRGRSSLDRNYPGIVAAHLARHKQYPAEARARGAAGVASVSFSLDGNGRVTSVRLVRSSGHPSLDTETVAMVRRASPFPAPPTGQNISFTVPVSFTLR